MLVQNTTSDEQTLGGYLFYPYQVREVDDKLALVDGFIKVKQSQMKKPKLSIKRGTKKE